LNIVLVILYYSILNQIKAAELYEEAAEMATMNMKGKLAAKYFEKAELAWGEVE